MNRRHSNEQSIRKGMLIDILEAIEIRESPIEQPIEVTKTQTTKKSKRVKRLDFSQE